MLYAYEPFDLMVRETVELMDENDKLKLENAKLRDTTYAWRTVDRLSRENAKLRKFAMETIRLMQADGPDCGLCKHYDECWSDEATNFSPTGCIICNEARELGIEVK